MRRLTRSVAICKKFQHFSSQQKFILGFRLEHQLKDIMFSRSRNKLPWPGRPYVKYNDEGYNLILFHILYSKNKNLKVRNDPELPRRQAIIRETARSSDAWFFVILIETALKWLAATLETKKTTWKIMADLDFMILSITITTSHVRMRSYIGT